MNALSCKVVSFMHSISIRCSFCLTGWIAIERVSYVLFPFYSVLKKPYVAKIISSSTILIVGLMHIYEVVSYRKIGDPSGESAYVADYSEKLRVYDRITVLIHYLVPFYIQIFSITVLIILTARNRSRTGKERGTYLGYLKRQFQDKKHYIFLH